MKSWKGQWKWRIKNDCIIIKTSTPKYKSTRNWVLWSHYSRGSTDSKIQGVLLNFSGPFKVCKTYIQGVQWELKGSKVLNVAQCPPKEDFLFFCVIICSFSSIFVLTMTIFGVSNSAKDLGIPLSHKGSHKGSTWNCDRTC